MDTVLACGSSDWLMMAGVIGAYGILALSGAALIKYLFFTRRSSTVA